MKRLSFDEAVERVLELVVPTEPELVTLEAALGRALVERAVATRDVPATDVAAVDGYAVRCRDLAAVPIELEVVATVRPGQTPGPLFLRAGQAVRVSEGATVLDGADAVVPADGAQLLGEGLVEIEVQVEPGANVRRRGEQQSAQSILVAPGEPVGLPEAAALWSQGLVRLPVRRRPTVAVAACGDGLCGPWEEPRGRIVDAVSPMLAEAVRLAGGTPTPCALLPERVDALVAGLAKSLKHDVLILVGDACRAEAGPARDALERLEVAIDFSQAAMRPGSPRAVGRVGRTLVFVLPGDPLAALVAFELLVRPALWSMQGLPPRPPRPLAHLEGPLQAAPDATTFAFASTSYRDGVLWARARGAGGAQSLMSALGSSHLLEVPPGEAPLPEGALVAAHPLTAPRNFPR